MQCPFRELQVAAIEAHPAVTHQLSASRVQAVNPSVLYNLAYQPHQDFMVYFVEETLDDPAST